MSQHESAHDRYLEAIVKNEETGRWQYRFNFDDYKDGILTKWIETYDIDGKKGIDAGSDLEILRRVRELTPPNSLHISHFNRQPENDTNLEVEFFRLTEGEEDEVILEDSLWDIHVDETRWSEDGRSHTERITDPDEIKARIDTIMPPPMEATGIQGLTGSTGGVGSLPEAA